MTNNSAMTLVLLLFSAMFVGVAAIILLGGGWTEHVHQRGRH